MSHKITLLLACIFIVPAILAHSPVNKITLNHGLNSPASLTIDTETEFPATFFVDEETLLKSQGNTFNIQPEQPTESYLFTPVPQLSYSRAYNFKLKNFKYNDAYAGKKYFYYQTDQRIVMKKFADDDLTIANFVDISIPDIIFSQESCTHFAFDSREMYSVSTCKDLSDGVIYLVMISYLSNRPFYVQSLKTSISETVQVKLVGEYVFILDHNSNTNLNDKIHVYRINIGSDKVSKQAMDIVGYVDASPYQVDSIDINSFDVVQVSKAYRVFMADKLFGLRTIELNAENEALTNAFSVPQLFKPVSVVVRSCASLESCFIVISNVYSEINYAEWTISANSASLNQISSFVLPKAEMVASKMSITNNYLVVIHQTEERKRVVVFYTMPFIFRNPVKALATVHYVTSNTNAANDILIDGLENMQFDTPCKVFLPNQFNELEEYSLRPFFSVQIANNDFKSTHLTLVSTNSDDIAPITVQIIRPAQANEEVSQPEPIEEVATGIDESSVQAMPFETVTADLEDSNDDSDDADAAADNTTVQGWFILFILLLAGLGWYANHLINESDKKERVEIQDVAIGPVIEEYNKTVKREQEPPFVPEYVPVEPVYAPEPQNEEPVTHYRLLPEDVNNRDEESRFVSRIEGGLNQTEDPSGTTIVVSTNH